MPFRGIFIGIKVFSIPADRPVEKRVAAVFHIYGAYESEENDEDCFFIEYSREGNKVGRTTMNYFDYDEEIKNKIISYFNLKTLKFEFLEIGIKAFNDQAPIFIAPDY